MTFEDLGRAFFGELARHSGGELSDRSGRIIVGRPVAYAGSSPDPALARQRYDLMFDGFGAEIHHVYEPLAAAFSGRIGGSGKAELAPNWRCRSRA